MIVFQLFRIMYGSLYLIKSYWKGTFIVRGMNKYKMVDSVDYKPICKINFLYKNPKQ